jgi:hypothetical protein
MLFTVLLKCISAEIKICTFTALKRPNSVKSCKIVSFFRLICHGVSVSSQRVVAQSASGVCEPLIGRADAVFGWGKVQHFSLIKLIGSFLETLGTEG